MSAEGPRKIEELLQHYAKKRREQEGTFSLHPATRRMLQGEVRRQYTSPQNEDSPQSWLAWFGVWRGRLAFSVAGVAVLVFSTWMICNTQQPTQPMRLAKNEVTADQEQRLREQ